jgi:hypothetical protein
VNKRQAALEALAKEANSAHEEEMRANAELIHNTYPGAARAAGDAYKESKRKSGLFSWIFGKGE